MAAEAEGMEALPQKPERRIRVEVVLHPGIAAEEVAEEVVRAAGSVKSKMRIGRDKIRLAVPPSRLEALADLPAVRRIERYAPSRPGANLACELVRAVALHGPPGLRGQGEIVAICDSGLDSGDLTRMHPHFNGRIHRLVSVGRRESTSDPHGHGTHCAGLIVGVGQSAEAPGQITGAAPDARLLVQSVFARGRPLAGIPLDLFDEGEGLDTGEEVRRDFVCQTPGLPLKVTLVWTDPPGERLQNDLDLIVRRADGTERHGNMAPGAQGFDRLNNVEQVLWEGFPTGPFTVLVRAHRNTFPGQTFALVVCGGI